MTAKKAVKKAPAAAPAGGAKKAPAKESAVAKATTVAKAIKQAPIQKKKKVRTTVRFRLKKGPAKARTGVPSRATTHLAKMHNFRILKCPVTSESAMKKVEELNTLVFLVDKRANKNMIKDAIRTTYQVPVKKVNTLVRPDGEKKAYIRLSADTCALDVANRIGVI